MEQTIYYLLTSNENKLKEYHEYGLSNLVAEKGSDLKEVEADPLTVILYKANMVQTNRLVEDVSFHVEGKDVGSNIRWLMDDLPAYKGLPAVWEVLIGQNDGEYLSVSRGVIEGTISDRFQTQVGFGFDCFFIPNGQDLTLYELQQQGRKTEYSARKKAVNAFLNQEFVIKQKIADLPVWTGKYQNE